MAHSLTLPALMNNPLQLIDQHPLPAVLIAVAAVAVVIPLVLVVRRVLRAVARASAATSAEHVLTVVAAALATGVAAQGMWQFFGEVLGFSGPLRVLTFAFIEVSVITSAVRARASMRASYSAGVDGIAVWVLTCLSAVLSSLDAHSFGEVVLRLSAPLVAAWLWERGMALERRRITGHTRIHWRLTPERVLVRLRLADPTDRTAGEVDAHRRLMRLALAAKHARATRTGGSARAQRRAMARLERAMERAVEHGALGTDPTRQETLLAQLGVLYNSASLLEVSPQAPWTPQVSDEVSSDVSSGVSSVSSGGTPQDTLGSGSDHSPAEDTHLPPGSDSDLSPGDTPRRRHRTPQDSPGVSRGHQEEHTSDIHPAADPAPPVSPHPSPGGPTAADLPLPPAETTRTVPVSTLFLEALTRHQGAIKAACADLARAGHKPPSRSYAHRLHRTWQSRQTPKTPPTPPQETPGHPTVSTRLTRVK